MSTAEMVTQFKTVTQSINHKPVINTVKFIGIKISIRHTDYGIYSVLSVLQLLCHLAYRMNFMSVRILFYFMCVTSFKWK